jgi:hypothetical protein
MAGQSIGGDRVLVVDPIENFIEHPEPSAHDGLRHGLISETDTRGDTLVLVGELPGERESRILCWLRIDLEILAHSEIERQVVANLKFVLRIKSIIWNAEGERGIASGLDEGIVLAQSKIRRVPGRTRRRGMKGIGAEKISRVKVSHMSATEIHSKLQVVAAAHVIKLFANFPLRFFGVGVRISRIANRKISAQIRECDAG